jgi:antitoxin YefM
MTTATYSHAREHLAQIWDSIEDAQQPVVLQRRGHQDMALLPADELASLQETAYLLRSPKNAERLLTALARSRSGTKRPITLERLRAALGVGAPR